MNQKPPIRAFFGGRANLDFVMPRESGASSKREQRRRLLDHPLSRMMTSHKARRGAGLSKAA
jgi:hypothetical protein